MFGLDILAVGVLQLAAAEISCQQKIVPKVHIKPMQSAIIYDYSKSRDDLGNFDIDTISPYSAKHKTHVGGLMSGEIQFQQRSEFMHEIYESLGIGCVHIKSVNIEINMDPVIYIAKEYPKKTCKHQAIMEHEKKHVRVDQVVINKYAKLIGQDIKKAIEIKGVRFGPFKVSELEAKQKYIQEYLGEIMIKRRDEMDVDRKEMQQAIDTKEEYDSISEICPGEH